MESCGTSSTQEESDVMAVDDDEDSSLSFSSMVFGGGRGSRSPFSSVVATQYGAVPASVRPRSSKRSFRVFSEPKDVLQDADLASKAVMFLTNIKFSKVMLISRGSPTKCFEILLLKLIGVLSESNEMNPRHFYDLIVFLNSNFRRCLHKIILEHGLIDQLLTHLEFRHVREALLVLVSEPHQKRKRGEGKQILSHTVSMDRWYVYLGSVDCDFVVSLMYVISSTTNPLSGNALVVLKRVVERLVDIHPMKLWSRNIGLRKLVRSITKSETVVADTLRVLCGHANEDTRTNCSEFLVHLMDQTMPSPSHPKQHQWMLYDHIPKDRRVRDRLEFKLVHVYLYLMDEYRRNFHLLSEAFKQEASVFSDRYHQDDGTIPFSGFVIRSRFGRYRLNLCRMLRGFVQHCAFRGDPTPFMGHLDSLDPDEDDIFLPLIKWFFAYPHNSLYSTIFKDIISDMVVMMEQSLLVTLFEKHGLLENLIMTYLSSAVGDHRGHILDICNVVRFSLHRARKSPKTSWFPILVSRSCPSWSRFLPVLLRHSMVEAGSKKEQDVAVNSMFAQEFGFTGSPDEEGCSLDSPMDMSVFDFE